MSEMQERVLRAIIGVIAEEIPDNRAALEATKAAPAMLGAIHAALREPTEAMARCEAIRALESGPPTRRWQWLWTSLIDEALK